MLPAKDGEAISGCRQTLPSDDGKATSDHRLCYQLRSTMLPMVLGAATNGDWPCYQPAGSAMLLTKIVLEYFEMGNEILFYTQFYFATLVFS
jgi:hypothetical protein